MGWGLELEWHELYREGCALGIVDAIRVRHEGERGEDYDYRAEAHRVHAELAERGFDGWKDVQLTVGTWRPWQRAPAWAAGEGRGMKLVMTLLARDEADVIDAQIAFHLHAGVDFVVATDNRSEDGTTEILERYQQAGRLHLLREPGDDMRQDEWVTRMARLAATDFGADWVLNADADEFWWPRGGSLKDVLALVPERYGLVRGCWRHFLPRAGEEELFAERMTVRLCKPAHPGEKATIFHAHQKVAHRADPAVAIAPGNHDAARPPPGTADSRLASAGGTALLAALGVAAPAQGGSRLAGLGSEPARADAAPGPRVRGRSRWKGRGVLRLVRGERRRARARRRRRQARRGHEAPGRAEGDSRRDGTFRLPDASSEPALSFPRPDVDDDALYAGEASVLVEIDGVVRAERRVDAFEERLAELERGIVTRARHRLARR